MASLVFAAFFCTFATAWAADLGFKFNGSKIPAFAEFRPWDPSTNGAIDLYFQTNKRNAILLYQDDSNSGDWIGVFLVNGVVRLRLRMGTCDRTSTDLKGNFTDSKWHRLKVERNFSMVSMSIDGIRSESLLCEEVYESPNPHKSSLYLGGIPLISREHWANPSILHYPHHGFTGCIARVRYRNGDNKLRKAKYRSSLGTTSNCQGACIRKNSRACKNGGKCVDLLVSMRCDCQGTGFTGMYCQKKLAVIVPFANTTSTTLVNTTMMVSAHALEKNSAVQSPSSKATMMLCGMCFILFNIYGQ